MNWSNFLDSNFFGALSGALIAGLVAIGINASENRRRKQEKNDEIEKKVSLLGIYSTEINNLLTKIVDASQERDMYEDPIGDRIDENGFLTGPIPRPEEHDEYAAAIAPYVNVIRESLIDLYRVLEEMKYLDVEILDKKDIVKVYKFKNEYTKNIEPFLRDQLQRQVPYVSDKKLQELKGVFKDLHKIVTNR